MKISYFLQIGILLTFLASEYALAQLCENPLLKATPVLAQGRVMPLYTHARHFRQTVLNKNVCRDLNDVELYCRLSVDFQSLQEKKCQPEFMVEHVELRKLLELEENGLTILPEKAKEQQFVIENEYRRLEAANELETGLGVAVEKLLSALNQYEQVKSGLDWKYLKETEWQSVGAIQDKNRLEEDIFGSLNFMTDEMKKSTKYEMIYENLKPFYLSAFICLVVFLVSLIGIKREFYLRASIWGSLFLLVFEVVGMMLRSFISGRAPVTNMFETVMWTGFGVLGLAVILTKKQKENKVLALGLGFNLICLFMMNFADKMLDGSIRPLTPVLRDNFWLATHVTTITLSYSCFAMSWVIANIVLIAMLFGKRDPIKLKHWNHIIRISMQVGSALLAVGIILGGVWADYSWGRFWGWDPKETWSLIALVVYMIILHGRYAGWFQDVSFTIVSAAGFLSVLMAWFGVNYILAAGLHSYGFSSGGASFLFIVFGVQAAIIALATQLRTVNT